jgi:hypothetical protein
MARLSGILPHEFLLNICRGEVVIEKYVDEYGVLQEREVYPDIGMRIDAAKAAAPFFAPKLSVQQVDMSASADLEHLSVDELKRRLQLTLARLQTNQTTEFLVHEAKVVNHV